jgi:hypothetical protein
MGKITDSIHNSWNIAVNFFASLPWWFQLLIAALIFVLIYNLILNLIMAIRTGGNHG